MTTRPNVTLPDRRAAPRPKPDLSIDRIGVVDIGSNSVRMVIYERCGAAATPVFNEKILAGLGRDLAVTGKLYPQGAAQTFKALTRFKALAKAHNLKSLSAVATAAMREADDGPNFVARVKTEIGIEIKVLSGEDEARMSAYGVIAGDSRARGVVADLGGASLELVRVDDRVVSNGKTLPLGPFVVSPQMITGGDYDAAALSQSVADGLAGAAADFNVEGETLYLVGGAWRNLALISNKRQAYPLPILNGFSMTPQAAMALCDWASLEAASDLMAWPSLSAGRARTLPYSAIVLKTLIEKLSPKRIVISPTGLREGFIYQNLPEAVKQREALHDACHHLSIGNEQGLHFGPQLYQWLGGAATLFPKTFETQSENRLRLAACLLVGMGKGLHPDRRAELVFDDVLYAPLSGLTHKERVYLALMLYSAYRGGKYVPNDAAINYHLLEREKQAARIYGTAMRLGAVISSRSADLLSQFTLTGEPVKGEAPAQINLQVSEGQDALFNRRGHLRLRKLAEMLGADCLSNWQTAQTE